MLLRRRSTPVYIILGSGSVGSVNGGGKRGEIADAPGEREVGIRKQVGREGGARGRQGNTAHNEARVQAASCSQRHPAAPAPAPAASEARDWMAWSCGLQSGPHTTPRGRRGALAAPARSSRDARQAVHSHDTPCTPLPCSRRWIRPRPCPCPTRCDSAADVALQFRTSTNYFEQKAGKRALDYGIFRMLRATEWYVMRWEQLRSVHNNVKLDDLYDRPTTLAVAGK